MVLFALLALALPTALLIDKTEGPGPGVEASSFMEDVRVVRRGEGERRWTLAARKISIAAGGASLMSDVTIEVPMHGLTVRSPSGTYDLGSHELTLDGNILATTEDYTIRTGSVRLDTDTGDFSTAERVVIEGANFIIEGDGMTADNDRKVRIKRNVTARFY